jgi:hypothetical protein
MGTPTTWRDSLLSSAALKRTELIIRKSEISIRESKFHSILSSRNCRLSPSVWWRERRPATSRFAPSPTINSVRYIAGDLRRPSPRIVPVQIEIRFELRDIGPSGRWHARRTTRRGFAPSSQNWVLRRYVKPHHRWSDLHGKSNYVE